MSITHDNISGLYDSAAVQRIVGLSWVEILALESAGKFPARVEVSGVWSRQAIDDFATRECRANQHTGDF